MSVLYYGSRRLPCLHGEKVPWLQLGRCPQPDVARYVRVPRRPGPSDISAWLAEGRHKMVSAFDLRKTIDERVEEVYLVHFNSEFMSLLNMRLSRVMFLSSSHAYVTKVCS